MTESHAQALRMQAAVNRLVRVLLHTPLISRVIGTRLLIIEFTGRKSGRRHYTPVAYTRHGDDLPVGTPFS